MNTEILDHDTIRQLADGEIVDYLINRLHDGAGSGVGDINVSRNEIVARMNGQKIAGFKDEYRFLSNFHPTPGIVFEGVTYPTTEHAYQAAKTTIESMRHEILAAKTPVEAKRLGRKLLPRDDWDYMKYDIMLDLIRSKFGYPFLKQKLIDTGSIYLEETNDWHDNDWGNCLCPKCIQYPGENHLGKILMRVRSEILRKEKGGT